MKLKKTAWIAAGTVAVLASSIFYYWSRGSSTISVQTTSKEVKGIATTNLTSIQNDYLFTSIPDRFRLKTQTKGSGLPIYLQQMYAATVTSADSLAGDQLAITIGKLDAQGLEAVSSVLLRRRDSAYSTVQFSGNTGILAFESATKNYELTVFVSHNNYYVAFSITSSGDSATTQRDMRSIVDALRWRI